MQKIQGLLLLVCDQPFLSLSHLQAMREAFESPQVELVASAYADTLGVPLLLSASLFPQLQQLPPHKGAQGLIFDTPEAQRRLIPFPKGEIDIDYPEDWEALNG
jgi:molybdenum cofactor cytidylyltransferase